MKFLVYFKILVSKKDAGNFHSNITIIHLMEISTLSIIKNIFFIIENILIKNFELSIYIKKIPSPDSRMIKEDLKTFGKKFINFKTRVSFLLITLPKENFK